MINQAIIVTLLLIVDIQFILIFGGISLTDYAQFNFAVNLLQKVANDDKSAIISPFSVSTSLFMVYLAADDRTEQQLKNVLGGNASSSQFRLHFAKQITEIVRGRSENYTLNIANHLYVREGFQIKKSFQRMLQLYYNETFNKFNLQHKNQLLQQMNNWIAERTNNKIKDMITEDSISTDAIILLLNAIYFSGTWKIQFIKQIIQLKPFHISKKETVMISMMENKCKVSYYADNFVKIIKLSYIGNEVEMVFILPKKRFGLSKVLKCLTGEKLSNYISNATIKDVVIKLPKFRVKGKLELKNALKKIGIIDIFSETANLGKLTDGKDSIFVSKIMHTGYIMVDEKGTESAAATVVEIINRMDTPYTFVADQPFLFAIVKNLKIILFLGQFIK